MPEIRTSERTRMDNLKFEGMTGVRDDDRGCATSLPRSWVRDMGVRSKRTRRTVEDRFENGPKEVALSNV